MMRDDRFYAFVEPEPQSGCWLWTDYRDGSGYGRVNRRKIANWRHVIFASFSTRTRRRNGAGD